MGGSTQAESVQFMKVSSYVCMQNAFCRDRKPLYMCSINCLWLQKSPLGKRTKITLHRGKSPQSKQISLDQLWLSSCCKFMLTRPAGSVRGRELSWWCHPALFLEPNLPIPRPYLPLPHFAPSSSPFHPPATNLPLPSPPPVRRTTTNFDRRSGLPLVTPSSALSCKRNQGQAALCSERKIGL